MNITDKIKTYEDACNHLNIDPIENLPFKEATTADQKAINALTKLTIIVRALNEGWTPDWKDSRQLKYYPWFRMNGSVGSGFSFYVSVFVLSDSYLGSRLVLKNAELANHIGNQFLDLYEDWMVMAA